MAFHDAFQFLGASHWQRSGLFRRWYGLRHLAILVEAIPEISFTSPARRRRTRLPVGIDNIGVMKAALCYIGGRRRRGLRRPECCGEQYQGCDAEVRQAESLCDPFVYQASLPSCTMAYLVPIIATQDEKLGKENEERRFPRHYPPMRW